VGSSTIAPELPEQQGFANGIVGEFSGKGVHVFLRVPSPAGPPAFLVFWKLAVGDEKNGAGLAENEEGEFVVGDAVHVVHS